MTTAKPGADPVRDPSTLSDVDPPDRRSPARLVRRVVTTLVVAAVVTAGTGLLGVHSTGSTTARDGWTLSVAYAGIARAGLDVPLRITVRHDGGFPGDEITLAVSREYLLLFEQQGFYPDAASSTSRGDDVLLTFDAPPDGDTLVVDGDLYVQPAAQAGTSGTVAVVRGGQRLVEVGLCTVLLP